MLQTSAILYKKLQRQYSRRINLDLKRIKKVLEKLNNPEEQIDKVVNIIGSDGKYSLLTSLKYFIEANNQKNLHRQSVLKIAWDAFFPTAPEDYVEFEQAWLVAREAALAEADLITLGEGL